MRRVVASLFASLDGFASDASNGEMRWVNEEMGAETIGFGLDQLRALDTLVLGRITYEAMSAQWSSARQNLGELAELINGIPKVVFSRTLSEEDIAWANTRLAKGDLAEEIASLKHQLGRDIGVSGSVDLVRSLVKRGLVDRLQLLVCPVVLGPTGGTPIFDGYDRTDLRLVASTVLDSRVALLEYEPAWSGHRRAQLRLSAELGGRR